MSNFPEQQVTPPTGNAVPPEARKYDDQTMNMDVMRQLRNRYSFANYTFLGVDWTSHKNPKLVEKKSKDIVMPLIEQKAEGLLIAGSAGEGKSTLLSLLVETVDKVSQGNYAWWFVLFDLLLDAQIKRLNKKTADFTQKEWDEINVYAHFEELRGLQKLEDKGKKRVRRAREFPGVGLVPNKYGISKKRGYTYIENMMSANPHGNVFVAVSSSEAVRAEARRKRTLISDVPTANSDNLSSVIETLKERGIDIDQDIQQLAGEGYEPLDVVQRFTRMIGASANTSFIDILWEDLRIDAARTQELLQMRNSPLAPLSGIIKLTPEIDAHLQDKHPEVSGLSHQSERGVWVQVILHWLTRMSVMGLTHENAMVAVNSFTPDLAKSSVTLNVMKSAYSGQAKTYDNHKQNPRA